MYIFLEKKIKDYTMKYQINISSYIIYIIFIIITSGKISIAQEVPTGNITVVVKDSDTDKPVPFVNVWLSNTSLGSASNENGQYTIRNVPFGNYVLVYSHVTYSPQRKNIHLSKSLLRVTTVRMKELLYESGEVVVSSMDQKEWKEYYKKFEEEFLGQTSNASHCKIINPEVLMFEKDVDTNGYTAHASGLLEIENNALGYRINYLLVDFISYNDRLRFAGVPQFVEMIPSDNQEMELWRENRLKSYQGSLRHFLASLPAGTTNKEGFLVQQFKKLPSDDTRNRNAGSSLKVRIFNTKTLIEPTDVEYLKKLKFEDYLQVEYTNEPAEDTYINQYKSKDAESCINSIRWFR